ncbi:MAG: hypothetical protein IPK80_29430 [Nannocystis sp.]|nr:hypothetical protein [Nannocystis sp.]
MTRRPRRPLAALASSLIVFAGLGAAACAPAYGTIVSSSATLGETDTTDPTAGESETWGTTSDACECGPEEACIDGACVDVGRGAIEAGCHPLSQGVCLYPWPSDFTTRPDPEASTGLRLDYDPELLPKNLNGVAFAADEVTARVDGFSPTLSSASSARAGSPAPISSASTTSTAPSPTTPRSSSSPPTPASASPTSPRSTSAPPPLIARPSSSAR